MLNTINYSQLYTEFPIISSFGLFLLGGKNKITLSILTADFLKQLFIYGCHGPSVLHGLLSSCGERGLPSTCSVRVPHSGGLLWSTGSGLMDFSSCSTWILERSCGLVALRHAGSSWMRDQTHVRASAGRFLTTEPPRKPQQLTF